MPEGKDTRDSIDLDLMRARVITRVYGSLPSNYEECCKRVIIEARLREEPELYSLRSPARR